MELISILAGCFGLYLVTKVLYNLHFHPLARFRGPLLWRAFQFPSLAAMLGGKMPYKVKMLHDQYGSIVRIAPNELSIIDDRAWKDIFQNRDFLRPPQYGARPPGVHAHNLISAPADVHARFRKAFAPAFAEQNVASYEPLIRGYFNILVSKLAQKAPSTFDMVAWFNYTTFDIIGDLCWGESFNCLESGKGHAFISVLLHFKAASIATAIKYYPALDALMPYITPKSALTMLQNVFETGHQQIQRRVQEQANRNKVDILGHVLHYNKVTPPSMNLTQGEIEFNGLTMIIAGSETLTTVLCGALYHIVSNPSSYQTLATEIRSAFQTEDQITAASVKPLPYLDVVINEVLRLCPPIPDNMRRAVPKGGATVAGHHFPEGTVVGVSCWSMFQSSSHFSNPEKFSPERWIPNIKDQEQRHNIQSFFPFSLGPHGCIGKSLALLEVRLLLALLFFHFDFESPPGGFAWKWNEQNIYWTWEKRPLPITIKKRG
ncbi:cytochrome P450 ClCP1 [Periconia macrospinosa]|uniref:Cytochrome P450 ClCP1 n=1 Tax=Periconia macrospinosa TaxID=97972 RepID=A0A2V1D9N3_9PLEO|nr:cytochrome P450 ClCP1 [Periconia macrospinosa]